MLKAIMRRILVWFMNTKFYHWLLLRVIPFIRFTTYYTRLRGNKYHEGYRILQPGQIILTVDEKKLTSVLIPGLMSHAAACVALRQERGVFGEDKYEVREMTHTNYTYSDFFDICKESSRVLIVDCLDWDSDYKKLWCDAVESLKDAEYDVEFELGVKALYCSELIYQADRIAHFKRFGVEGNLLRVDLSDIAGLGRKYLSPDGLLFAKNIRCIWDSDGILSGMMGEDIEKYVDAKR